MLTTKYKKSKNIHELTKNTKQKGRPRVFKNKLTLPIICVSIAIVLALAVLIVPNSKFIDILLHKFSNGSEKYFNEVRNIEIASDNYSLEGSWHIDKSTKWTGKGNAQVTYDIDSIVKTRANYNKDIVLVLDSSKSMSGEKMTNAKSDIEEFIEYVLSNPNNKISIITFGSSSTIVSDFSNNKEVLIKKLNTIKTGGAINYNSALLKVNSLMDDYVKQNNRDVVTLFLTNGYPNKDNPNQIGTYAILKEKYPYMNINGIQYEMGTQVIDDIKKITDAQRVADQSTLKNVLLDSSVSPVAYEKFMITEYINNDYFYINSVNDIDVSIGTVRIEEESGTQKIIWDLGANTYVTGNSAKMNINLKLKDSYLNADGYYPTTKKQDINSKLPEENENTVSSTNTLVLKSTYKVHYDPNAPTGCMLSPIGSETYAVYENVTKKTESLTCDGYLFKGWEIAGDDASDITKVNDDVFVMPEHDVTIRATWSKHSISKTMDGTVYERSNTLYKVLQLEAETGGLAKEYTGNHQDTLGVTGDKKIYHYYAENDIEGTKILNKNNIIFADMCWQMIRTTDTGGVKILYNGEPDANGKCGTNRGTHVGYKARTTLGLSSSAYYYGTSYTYNSSTKKFSLAGNKRLTVWSTVTGPKLVGLYTCKSTDSNGTCETLYYIESYKDGDQANVLPIDTSANYSNFGTVEYNTEANSPAYVGYMYNKIYTSHETTIEATYMYAKDFTYENGIYKLNTDATLMNINDNVFKINEAHYTCFNTTGECTTLSYIYYYDGSRASYINLTGGKSIENALEEMLSADNVNTKNSVIKNAIDAWYAKYLTNYSSYLEDTIFCNNRSVSKLGSWNPNGGNIMSDFLEFKEYNTSSNLTCPNITDRFSISNAKAKLKYPVGLMTASEINLLNKNNARTSGGTYWLASPGYFFQVARAGSVNSSGNPNTNYIYNDFGVRPTVSLAPDTEFSDGDGSMDNPYIVDLSE